MIDMDEKIADISTAWPVVGWNPQIGSIATVTSMDMPKPTNIFVIASMAECVLDCFTVCFPISGFSSDIVPIGAYNLVLS